MHEGMKPTTSALFMPRRQFVRNLAAVSVAAASTLSPRAAEEPTDPQSTPVGSNIFGWSQYYQRDGKNVMEHLDEVMSALRDAGYDYLEGNVDTQRPENNLRLAERMRARGLKPVCLYTGGRLHEEGKAEKTVQTLLEAAKSCKEAGFTLIDCNPDPIGRDKTEAELSVQARAVQDIGAGLRKLGIRFAVHNHTPEMANHAREFHEMLNRTQPADVGLCYDIHWVYRGGITPADCLRQYGNRIASWHLRQSRNGIWWEDLDTGDIDFEAVARYVKEHHLTAPYTVELALEKGTKITRTVVENHRRSRQFVWRVFGS